MKDGPGLMPARAAAASFAIIAALWSVANFYANTAKLTPDFPIDDDFAAILKFAIEFQDAGTFGERVALLWAQYFEHRFVFLRVVTLLFAWAGTIDLYAMNLLGAATLFGSALVLCFAGRPHHVKHPLLRYAVLAPVFLLVFQFHHYALVLNTAGAMTSTPVFLPAFLALLWIARPGAAYFAAALAAALGAVLVFGNGLFLVLPGALILLVTGRWRALIVWLLVFAAVFALYFVDYYNPRVVAQDSPFENFGLKIVFFLFHVGYPLGSVFDFLGGWDVSRYGSTGWLYPQLIVGTVLCAASAWVLWGVFGRPALRRQRSEKEPEELSFAGMILWLLLSLAAASLSRLPEDGVVYVSRYLIVPAFLCAVLYLLWLRRQNDLRPVFLGIVPVLVVWNVYVSDVKKDEFRNARNYYAGRFEIWRNTGEHIPYFDNAEGSRILRKAARRGLYDL